MHTQLGTMSSENVAVEIAVVVVDLVASASGTGSLQECCFGRSCLSFRPGTDSGFGEA